MSELREKVPRHLRHPRFPGGMSTTKGDYFYRIPFITALIIMDFILTAGGGYGCRIIAAVVLCMRDRTIFSTPLSHLLPGADIIAHSGCLHIGNGLMLVFRKPDIIIRRSIAGDGAQLLLITR